MNGARAIAGRQIVGLLRSTECGHWYLTTQRDLRLGGALLLDPALVTTTDRLVEELQAVRAAALPGVQPIADLVEQDDHVWLLTDAAPGPTVRELLEAGPARGLDSGSAATLLNETAQTLLALHHGDVAHGGFGPSTVVVSPDGRAALTEVALAAALGLRSVTPRDDVRDWARLAIQLAGEWCGGAAADMVTRAAAAADRSDLAEAREVLLDGREVLPPDFIERRPLVSAAAQWIEFMRNHARSAAADTSGPTAYTARSLLEPRASQAAQPLIPSSVPAPGSAPVTPASGGAVPSIGGVAPPDAEATHVELAAAGGQPPPPTDVSGAAPMWRDEVPPRAAGTPAAGPPGAPTPMWREERYASPPPGGEADGRGPGGYPHAAPSRSARVAWRGLLVVGVVAGVLAAGLFWWQQRSDESGALAVTGVSITPVESPVGCDAQVDVVGVVASNGDEGEIRYRWVRNDDQTGEVYRVTVPDGQTETPVTLRWTFKGSGTFDATARLEVLEPSAASGETSFAYACE